MAYPLPTLLESFRPLRRGEYDRLVALGTFAHEHVELVDGVLVAMSHQGAEHAHVTALLAERLAVALRGRAGVRARSPLSLSDESGPEPDLAVVPLGDYSREHPAHALLVVEVADSSLRKDRDIKAGLYARAGISEYWLVDLVGRVVDVHRGPNGNRYTDASRVAAGASLRLLSFPDVAIDLSDVIARP